ncbi:MAG: LCP family protein [Clostridia bacterium]|nr:LCP family protein [Clostridia bacterium]
MRKEAKAKENMKKKRKKSKLKKILGILFVLLILGGAGTVAAIWIKTQMTISKYTESGLTEEVIDPLSAAALGLDADKLAKLERINVLVMGESGVGDGYNLTDSIMVASYNPQTQQAGILSIPRDTYVGRKDKNSASQSYLQSYKVNAAYRNGENIPETVELVSNLTGVDLEYYVLIDTSAIIDLVDAVGGITFDVPIDMDYDDDTQDLHIHLQAGEQLIDGDKAEQLLRFRHNNDGSSYPTEYGDNDLGRMRTQREFIQEAARQLIKLENVPKALSIMDIVFKNVRTNIDFETAKYYIPYVFKFNAENIVSDMVPGVPEKVNGVWIYTANKAQTAQVVEDLFADRVYEENEETTEGTTENTVEGTTTTDNEEKTTVELLNGTGNKELLTKAKAELKKAGYDVTKSGETSETEKTLIINRTKQASSVSKDIKETVGTGTIQSGSDNSKVDFTVILGQDYE